MKTTIKLGAGRALIVQPQGEGVRVDLTFGGVVMGGDVLTPDQCGALMIGLERATEAAGIAADRASEGIASARRINRAPGLALGHGARVVSDVYVAARYIDAQRASCAASGCNYPEGECSGAMGGCLGCRRAAA